MLILDVLQDSADNSSIGKFETSLEWLEYFSQFQGTTDALPCHIHLLYACEPWTLTVELQRRIQAMEMRCYRKILRISYKDHVTNQEIRVKIQRAIGPHEDLLTIVKRRKMQCYGHVSRSSGLTKPCKAQWKREEEKADRGRGGKTTSENGQAWSSLSSRRQWRTGKNGGNWLLILLWCPNHTRG